MNESDLLADNISMLVIFLILNIFDITASANDELRIQFKRIIEEIDGYEELPPCEGLEKLSDLSVHKYPPAPVCHDLFPIYENFLKFDRQMRKDCLALEKMTRSYMENYQDCQIKVEKIDRRIRNMKKRLSILLENSDLTEADIQKIEAKEASQPDCYLSGMVLTQFRAKILSQVNRHYSNALESAEKVCTAKTPDAQEKIARDYLQRPANH